MNRAHRRAPGYRVAPLATKKDFTIDYGHDGAAVCVFFRAGAIDNLRLTLAQTDEMIKGLEVARDKMKEHLAVPKEGANG